MSGRPPATVLEKFRKLTLFAACSKLPAIYILHPIIILRLIGPNFTLLPHFFTPSVISVFKSLPKNIVIHRRKQIPIQTSGASIKRVRPGACGAGAQHPGFWFFGGNLALCRFYSRLLALQLKRRSRSDSLHRRRRRIK